MLRVLYITAKTPYGDGEEFVIPEMHALKNIGVKLVIVPRDACGHVLNGDAQSLTDDVLSVPIISLSTLLSLMRLAVTSPLTLLKIINSIVVKARTGKIALKNLAVLPKAVRLAQRLSKEKISHIHSHWASTTATIGYVTSRLTGIPWSFTAHRWDIKEDNILKQKVESASFVRVISSSGKDMLCQTLGKGDHTAKIVIIHMGVPMPAQQCSPNHERRPFTICCPANLGPVKGHRYLLEACSMLKRKNLDFRCLIVGDGPLGDELRRLSGEWGIMAHIEFIGRLPHEKILDLYQRGEINAVVLPSIVTEDGEHEGIPVSLMEAMACGIPVISTNTGGIPELISDGSGIMVEEKNSEALAVALEMLMADSAYFRSIGLAGREKIEKDFDISVISQRLLTLLLGSDS